MARHPYGRISREQYEAMAPSLTEAGRAALALLVGDAAPVRASAGRYDDDELPVETCALYPPGTFDRETDRRVAAAERIAASAREALSDDELYRMLWPEGTEL